MTVRPDSPGFLARGIAALVVVATLTFGVLTVGILPMAIGAVLTVVAVLRVGRGSRA
jgi:hypothetical protein